MRVFVYDDREFPDPDPTKSPEEVKSMMTDFFPELANAEVKEHTRGEDTLHEFVRRVGTKGKRRQEGPMCDNCYWWKASKGCTLSEQGMKWKGPYPKCFVSNETKCLG